MAQDKLITAVIGGGAGAFAAYITNLFQFRRLDRNAIYELTHDLYSDIAVYWGRSGRDELLEKSITRSNHKLASKARYYGSLYLSQKDYADLQGALRDLVMTSTGDDFEVSRRMANVGRVERCQSLLDSIRQRLNEAWVFGTIKRLFQFGK